MSKMNLTVRGYINAMSLCQFLRMKVVGAANRGHVRPRIRKADTSALYVEVEAQLVDSSDEWFSIGMIRANFFDVISDWGKDEVTPDVSFSPSMPSIEMNEADISRFQSALGTVSKYVTELNEWLEGITFDPSSISTARNVPELEQALIACYITTVNRELREFRTDKGTIRMDMTSEERETRRLGEHFMMVFESLFWDESRNAEELIPFATATGLFNY